MGMHWVMCAVKIKIKAQGRRWGRRKRRTRSRRRRRKRDAVAGNVVLSGGTGSGYRLDIRLRVPSCKKLVQI